MSYFNIFAWREFEKQLAHRHTFSSDHGYLAVNGIRGGATLLKCKCGSTQWFFR